MRNRCRWRLSDRGERRLFNRSGRPSGPAARLITRTPEGGRLLLARRLGGHVIISGGPEGSLFPTGSTTSLLYDRAVGTCDAATIEPGKLELGHVAHANCGDPALYGEQVLAVSYLTQPPASRANGLGEFAVRIAHVDTAARNGYTLGPIVMTYPQARTATRSGSTATARSGSMTHTTAPLRARTVSCSASRTPPGQWCSAGRSHRTRENCWRSMPTVSGSHRLLKAVNRCTRRRRRWSATSRCTASHQALPPLSRCSNPVRPRALAGRRRPHRLARSRR